MKAYQCNPAILCPECGQVMQYNRDTKTVKCIGRECALKSVEYHAPPIEIEPVIKPPGVEYVILQEQPE